jgi:hypothetical protein
MKVYCLKITLIYPLTPALSLRERGSTNPCLLQAKRESADPCPLPGERVRVRGKIREQD